MNYLTSDELDSLRNDICPDCVRIKPWCWTARRFLSEPHLPGLASMSGCRAWSLTGRGSMPWAS